MNTLIKVLRYYKNNHSFNSKFKIETENLLLLRWLNISVIFVNGKMVEYYYVTNRGNIALKEQKYEMA